MKKVLGKRLLVTGLLGAMMVTSGGISTYAEETEKITFTDLDGQEHVFEEPPSDSV